MTYIPMRRGFLYLVAIMDWFSRKVLAWRLSNTMDADFCVAALEEAIARHGRPDIFNTDQGSQFTSFAFTTTLKDAGIRISMDGRGRWMDNVFIERLWRSLKYECVFLNAFETGSEARSGIGSWIDYYNRRRPHSSLRRQDTRRGLCYGRNDGATGGVETTPIHLSQAAKLSHQAGPPQTAVTLVPGQIFSSPTPTAHNTRRQGDYVGECLALTELTGGNNQSLMDHSDRSQNVPPNF